MARLELHRRELFRREEKGQHRRKRRSEPSERRRRCRCLARELSFDGRPASTSSPVDRDVVLKRPPLFLPPLPPPSISLRLPPRHSRHTKRQQRDHYHLLHLLPRLRCLRKGGRDEVLSLQGGVLLFGAVPGLSAPSHSPPALPLTIALTHRPGPRTSRFAAKKPSPFPRSLLSRYLISRRSRAGRSRSAVVRIAAGRST